MGDTIVIETPVATVLEVSGKQGPQGVPGATGATGAVGPAGPAGTGIETLTTKGDLLSRNDSAAIRVGIGTTGQVLKVSAQGLPTWANESGAVTSVNGATGAVTVAAEQHASEHEAGEADEIQAMAALVDTDYLPLNGVYFWDGTTTSGRPNFFRTGTRKNTKIVYNSGTNQWNLVRNLTVEAVGVDGPSAVPWGNTWEEFVTPTTVTVTRLPLETMVQKLAETGGAATATTSEDGLMSSADKTKLNGIAANATANTASSATPSALGTAAAGSSSDYARADHIHSAEVSDSAFRVTGSTDATKKVAIEVDTNVPSGQIVTLTAPSASGTIALAGDAPSAHKFSHAIGGIDALAPSDIGAQFAFVTTAVNLDSGGTYTISAGRARRIEVSYASSDNGIVQTPSSASQTGDLIVVAWTGGSSGPAGNIVVQGWDGGQYVNLSTLDVFGQSVRLIFKANNAWEIDPVYTHTHTPSEVGLGNVSNSAQVTSVSGTAPIVSSGGTTPAISVTVGTTANTVAAGDDSRITGAAQKSANLSDLASASTARTNLGLGTAATAATGDFAAASHTHSASAISDSTTAGRALLTAADAAAQRTSLGLGTLATQSGTFSGTSSGTNTGDQTITLTGDVTGSGTGSFVATIAANAVVNADLAQVATNTIKGRAAAGTGNVEDLSATQVRTVLGLAAIATSGSASDLGSGTVPIGRLGASGTPSGSTYLAGDNSWKAVSGVTTGSVDNAVLRADGTGGSTSQSSDISIEDATTSTQNNVQISNQHSGQTNSALVLTPKGTGAFIVGARPTGAATTGNARGANATDLQQVRSAATQVASGTRSGIMCGTLNTNAGLDAFLGGGDSCSINSNGSYAFIGGGDGNSVTAYAASIVGGFSNVASNQYATTWGYDNTASGISSTAFGVRALADRESLVAVAGGRFASDGDAQRIAAILRGKTTTNAAVELFMGLSNNIRLTIASGKVMAMLINITGVKSDGSAVAHYVRQYAIKNVGGTTSEVYAAVTIGTDNAAGTSITLSANDTNDAVKIEATGIASETWRWVASVDAVEVAYGT